MEFFNHEIIEITRLDNRSRGEGTAYVLDRLANRPTLEQIAYWEDHGAIVSERHHLYAPEIREMFVFVPDSVMVWACPDEDCSGGFMENPQILKKEGDSWACPNCGRITYAPAEDAYVALVELV